MQKKVTRKVIFSALRHLIVNKPNFVQIGQTAAADIAVF